MAEMVFGADASDGSGVSSASGLQVLPVAASARTATVVDAGIRAAGEFAETVFQAAGNFAIGASWDLGEFFSEMCAAAMVWARFVAVAQRAYAVYCHREWLGELLRGICRPPTIGEAAHGPVPAGAPLRRGRRRHPRLSSF